MTSRTITLITPNDSTAAVSGRAGLLVETAADASWLPKNAVPIEELLGPWEEAKRRAAEFVVKWIAGEPEIEGVRHFYALKEIFIRAAYQHQLTLHLHEWLLANDIERCVFHAHSPFVPALRQVQKLSGASGYSIEAPDPPKRSRLQATKEFLQLKGAAGLRELPWLAAQRLSPLRARLLQRHRSGPITRNDWWFYSTFYTFTNIGLAYERALGRQFRFLTELRGSAEKPLRQVGRDWDDLYSYAEGADLPSAQEIEAARTALRLHLEKAHPSNTVAGELLLSTGELENFFRRMLPIAMLQARALSHWLDKAQPSLIVVGNEAWEGILLQLAHARGIPTVVLQHGILGDFYQFTEHAGDVIVVRGEFWQRFLSEASQTKSAVLNCDAPGKPAVQPRGRDLLFITTDYRAMPYWHPAGLDDIMEAAAGAAFEAKARLIVRIHPRDAAEPYRQSFARVYARLGVKPDVEFSMGAGLEEKIRSSAVALLYSSTVFLDCLRLGVPVVSPAWHHFAFKDMLQAHGVFHFAHNLSELRSLLVGGLRHELPASQSYEQFLASTNASEVQTFFTSRAAKGAAGS